LFSSLIVLTLTGPFYIGSAVKSDSSLRVELNTARKLQCVREKSKPLDNVQ